MNSPLKTFTLGIVTAAGLATSAISGHAQSATATITGTPAGGGLFNYTIILDNTGTFSLNGFWYGWTTSGNNLPSVPVNGSAGNSLGWTGNSVSGNSIMWQNTGNAGSALRPGHTATFTFVDSSTIGAIATPPAGDYVAYVGNIDFRQGAAGDSTGVFSVIQPAPEPSTLGLMAVAFLALLFRAAPVVRSCLGISRK